MENKKERIRTRKMRLRKKIGKRKGPAINREK